MVRPKPDTTWLELIHVCHEEGIAQADVPARRRDHDGASAARIHGARVHGAGADTGQGPAAVRRGLLPERRHEQALVPRRDEPGLRVQDDSQAARAVPRSGHVIRQSVACRRQGGHRSRRQLRRVVERCGRQADRGRGHPRRHQHRPGHCEADRSGHATAVDGSGDGGFQRLRRRLRAGLQLRLHEQHLLGIGDAVEPDGDQSARRVRADVRAVEHDGRASRAYPGRPQHPRLSDRGGARPAAEGRGQGSRAHRRLPRQRP